MRRHRRARRIGDGIASHMGRGHQMLDLLDEVLAVVSLVGAEGHLMAPFDPLQHGHSCTCFSAITGRPTHFTLHHQAVSILDHGVGQVAGLGRGRIGFASKTRIRIGLGAMGRVAEGLPLEVTDHILALGRSTRPRPRRGRIGLVLVILSGHRFKTLGAGPRLKKGSVLVAGDLDSAGEQHLAVVQCGKNNATATPPAPPWNASRPCASPPGSPANRAVYGRRRRDSTACRSSGQSGHKPDRDVRL